MTLKFLVELELQEEAFTLSPDQVMETVQDIVQVIAGVKRETVSVMPYPFPSDADAAHAYHAPSPLPWYVEVVRPGQEDFAHIFDAESMGVCKPTTSQPLKRRSLAEWICKLANSSDPGIAAKLLAALERLGDLDVECSQQEDRAAWKQAHEAMAFAKAHGV